MTKTNDQDTVWQQSPEAAVAQHSVARTSPNASTAAQHSKAQQSKEESLPPHLSARCRSRDRNLTDFQVAHGLGTRAGQLRALLSYDCFSSEVCRLKLRIKSHGEDPQNYD